MALFLPRSTLDIKEYWRPATAECARPRCTLHTSSHSETRIVESQKVAFSKPPIPKGLRIKAQGCEERATLGKCTEANSTPAGLRHGAVAGQNHAGVAAIIASVISTAPSQPLGWTTLSLALKIRVRCSVLGQSKL